MDAAYYQQKISEFSTAKSQVSNIVSYANACLQSIATTKQFIENLVILGEPIDKGVLTNDITTAINNMISDFTTIMNECDEKIAKYQALYDEAIRQVTL